MNVVIDEAAEVYVKDAKPRRELGTFQPSKATMAMSLSIHRSYTIER